VADTVYHAAKKANVRVIIQQGWAGLGKNLFGREGVSFVKGTKTPQEDTEVELDVKKDDFCLVIGRVAHSWLFDHVMGVCHHGGAGTTYAGLSAAKPTLIAPFFGDQPFWGQMVHNAGAGPKPLPVDKWTVDNLASKFEEMGQKSVKDAAQRLSASMRQENGAEKSVYLHYHDYYYYH